MARKKKDLIESPISKVAELREVGQSIKKSNRAAASVVENPLYPDVDGFVIDKNDNNISDVSDWILTYERMLKSLCWKYRSIDEPDELYQVVCISVFKCFNKYDPHQRDVKRSTYLWVCAQNAILEYRRKKRAQKRAFSHSAVMEYYGISALTPRDEDGVMALITDSGEDSLMKAENYAFWMDAIEKLPPNQRDTIKLTIKGRTQVEIAKILGRRQSCISYYLNQARATLNELRKVVA